LAYYTYFAHKLNNFDTAFGKLLAYQTLIYVEIDLLLINWMIYPNQGQEKEVVYFFTFISMLQSINLICVLLKMD